MLRRRGFTLGEMMVVLIIGILVAIALPSFLRARENARLRACVANMKQIEAAIEEWAMENKASGDTPVPSDVGDYVPTYLPTIPTCPSGGRYHISGNANDYSISCDYHGELNQALCLL